MDGTKRARPFQKSDAPALLALMRGLAEFEGYLEGFRVSEDDLIRYGLGKSPRFRAYVVDGAAPGELLGMAVTYVIPWTYSMRPNLVLKELFVAEPGRGQGVGTALMRAVIGEAKERDAHQLLWAVLPSNREAKEFYRSIGAHPDLCWENWSLSLDECG
ncbi:MAG: GNAT family N-acetyltransferase [Myxococcota bacterium]